MDDSVQISRESYEAALNATSLATAILLKADKDVEVHKHPNGNYYVRFVWDRIAVNRSCKTKDRRQAYVIAKKIRRDYILNHSQGKPTSAAECKDRKLKEVIKLYHRFLNESDKAPRHDTGLKYIHQMMAMDENSGCNYRQ